MKRKFYTYKEIRHWLWHRCEKAEDRKDWAMYGIWANLFNQLSEVHYLPVMSR